MKVVNICLTGPVTDGWNYQDNLLPKYQKILGYDVDVITSQYVWTSNGKIELFEKTDYVNEYGVKIHRLPNYGKTYVNSKFKRCLGLYELLLKTSPDILFVHGCQFCDISTIVKYLCTHTNVVTYVDNHADFSNSATNWMSKNILHKIIWRHYAQQINPFVKKWYGVLPARVDFLKDVYGIPANKIEFLPMGADDDFVEKYSHPEIRLKYRKKYDITEDDQLIVSGGKIDLAKKQTLLLMDAINQIDNPKLKLIVFGSVVPELKREVEKRCSGKVKYIGWISSEESYPHFAMADLVAFPGRHSVFWEQVAGMGIPMVVKYWDGTTHIDCGGNVKFLHEDSIDEIRKIIENVFFGDELNKMRSVAEINKIFFSYREIAKKSLI